MHITQNLSRRLVQDLSTLQDDKRKAESPEYSDHSFDSVSGFFFRERDFTQTTADLPKVVAGDSQTPKTVVFGFPSIKGHGVRLVNKPGPGRPFQARHRGAVGRRWVLKVYMGREPCAPGGRAQGCGSGWGIIGAGQRPKGWGKNEKIYLRTYTPKRGLEFFPGNIGAVNEPK